MLTLFPAPRRLFVATLLLAVSSFAAPAANAQWITLDPTNAAAMVKQFIQISQQIRTARDQYTSMIDNLQTLAHPEDWDADAWLADLESAHDNLDALSYIALDVDAQMEDLFGTGAYDDFGADQLEQLERTLATMRTAVNAMHAHRVQIEDARGKIDALRAQSQSATGNLDVIQAQTNAALFQAENLQLLREQISTMTTMMAVQTSRELSERLQTEASIQESRQVGLGDAQAPVVGRPIGY